MFDDLLKETVTLRYPSGTYEDGKTVYNEVEEKAFAFDYNERLLSEVGLVKSAKFFVIAATDDAATCFSGGKVDIQIVHDEKTYDVKTVKTCRNLDGSIECFSVSCI